jgi:protein-S-isoprenylcysteine O-methyltransferase Ste14
MTTRADSEIRLPASATRGWIVAAGLAAWGGTLWLTRSFKMLDAVEAAFICMSAMALVNYFLDALFLKVHQRESTGLDLRTWNPSVQRTVIKFAGLLASLGFIGLLYWIFPEYSRDFFGEHKDHPLFYGDYKELLARILPWWLGLAIPYFYFVDARQKDKQDGYYAAGMAITLRLDQVDSKVLWQHCLSWLVKGYFLALMFTYCVRDTRIFIHYDFSTIQNFRTFFDFAYYLIFLVDVGLSCAGYLFSLRIFDTHVRRSEPTFMGWAVALFCYQPFWSWMSGAYFNYENGYVWGGWLQDSPMLYQIWGSAILLLYGIYVWATIMFGARFSNLTHRGILTSGPYRWSKHPAYIAKCLAYWLTFVPFIVSQSLGDSIRRCLLLGLLNYIYYLRAKTEEANLSSDPVYVQYADWIKAHGIFRWFPSPHKS